MANKMITILNAISKAVYNKHHGSGVDFGLRRDEENPEVCLDGFNIKFVSNRLVVSYNSEENIENLHDPKFESKIDDTIDKIVSNIKKQYKENGGEGTLKLEKEGELVARAETVNRRKALVTARRHFKIKNLNDLADSDVEDTEETEVSKDAKKAQDEFNKSQAKLQESYKKFLDLLPEGKLYG